MGLCCYILEHVGFDFEFFGSMFDFSFSGCMCLYCEYVVFDLEFSGCVCIVSMLYLILNFLDLYLFLNFLYLIFQF